MTLRDLLKVLKELLSILRKELINEARTPNILYATTPYYFTIHSGAVIYLITILIVKVSVLTIGVLSPKNQLLLTDFH